MKSLAAFIFICAVISPTWCITADQNETDLKANMFHEDTDLSVEADRDGKHMDNIGYLLSGYDIMRGNPLDVEKEHLVDPGFCEPIFKAEYKSHKMTPDRRYLQPDGTSIHDCSGSCLLSFSFKEIFGADSYQSSLGARVSESVGGTYEGFGAKFSASKSFKDVMTRTSSQTSMFTQSYASCCSYTAQTLTYNLPPFSDGFRRAINQLPKKYDERAYSKFIHSFGTHYIKKAEFGALFGQQSELLKETWTSMMENEFNIKLAAEGSVDLEVYGASVSEETDISAKITLGKEYVEKSVHQKIFTIGAVPPRDMNVSTWLEKTKDAPEPMSLELGSIMELFENKKIKVSKTVKDNIQKALKEYCGILLENGDVTTCSKFGADLQKKTSPIVFKEKRAGVHYWGKWGEEETCPFPHFANKMELRIESQRNHWPFQGDDTALNTIRLTCTDGSRITSRQGNWGNWRGVKSCPAGTLIQMAKLRRESSVHGGGDQTSANGIKFRCTDPHRHLSGQLSPGDGYWGDWSEWEACEKGSAVYGLKTRVQESQGGNDDTGLNDVEFLCAKLPERVKGDCDKDSDCAGSLICGTDNAEFNPFSGKGFDGCVAYKGLVPQGQMGQEFVNSGPP